jgi:hypothetical protein
VSAGEERATLKQVIDEVILGLINGRWIFMQHIAVVARIFIHFHFNSLFSNL